MRTGTEFRRIRFADRDCARCLDAVDDQVVGGGNVVLEDGRAKGSEDAFGVDEILVGDGQAVEGAEGFALGLVFVGSFSGLPGLIESPSPSTLPPCAP